MLDSKKNEILKKKIEIYKGAIITIKSQISNEKFGLILDSGGHRPEIVNTDKIKELEESLAETERKLMDCRLEIEIYGKE